MNKSNERDMTLLDRLQMDYKMPTLNVSFKFFPPKTIGASFLLRDKVQTLVTLGLRFVSVIYGTGGTTRQLTRKAIGALVAATDLSVVAHLTCVDATKEDTLSFAKSWAKVGGKSIVILRGDPPKAAESFMPHPKGFKYSCDMSKALSKV